MTRPASLVATSLLLGCTADPQPIAATESETETDTVAGTADATTTGDGTGNDATTQGSDTTTGDPSATTTSDPADCMSADDCDDATAAFCTDEGTCVSCDEMPEPDAACTSVDAAHPVCIAGACVECSNAQATACTGTTPLCGPDNTCTGCTEHTQCPQSACHLDGPQQGACFETSDVVAHSAPLKTWSPPLKPCNPATTPSYG
jgi:hypothetical protein